MEEELRQGFITLPGGHRAGLAGDCLVEDGRVSRIRSITGINLRIAKEMVGIARSVLPYLWGSERFLRTLIISPPQAGKTTLLRDLVRALGDGDWQRRSYKVGLIDERSEIAGSFHGLPQLHVGIHTDVLDGCPKAEGIYRLLRAMGPEVIAFDELGRPEEVEALRDLLYAGVGILATAHAGSIEEMAKRPILSSVLGIGGFERVIVLSRRLGVGTVEGIWDGTVGEMLSLEPFRLVGGSW
jgi:stage III sporulation protein AA